MSRLGSRHGRDPAPGRYLWPVAVVGVVLAGIAIRLHFEPRFFYWDDTQFGSTGEWYELGKNLLNGRWQYFNPSNLSAGNYIAEGQWAVFNPLTILVGAATYLVQDTLFVVTAVKSAYVLIFALGGYALAREFGARRGWAFFAGVSIPFTGVVLYLDMPSWVSDLQNYAMFVWAWWAFTRVVRRGARLGSVAVFVVSSYLLVTQGYIYGVLALIVVLVEHLVWTLVRRDWAGTRLALLLSVFPAGITVLVFLPGILSAAVTQRATGVANSFWLTAGLGDFLTSGNPLGTTAIAGWWGDLTSVPIAYITWALPLIAFAIPAPRAALMRLRPVIVFGAAWLLYVCGPSDFGPLRWPGRALPYVATAAILVLVVLLSEFADSLASRTPPSRAALRVRALIAGLLAAVGFWSVFAQNPLYWRSAAAVLVIHLIAVLAVYWLLRRRRTGFEPMRTFVPLVSAAVTLAFVGLQAYQMPTSPLADWHAPTRMSEIRDVYAGAVGSTFPVGSPLAATQEDLAAYSELAVANLVYAADVDSAVGYTIMPNKALFDDICFETFLGATCGDAWEQLFSTDPETGRPLVDLMGINSLVVVKESVSEQPATPDGWHLASTGEFRWIYTRDVPLDSEAQVTSASDGVAVTQLSTSDTEVVLRVDDVPASGGTIVLKRLDWPGYSVEGAASVADPLRGWLLTVKVDPDSAGTSIVIRFRPPGYPLMIAGTALSVLSVVALVALSVRRRRRERAGEVTERTATG